MEVVIFFCRGGWGVCVLYDGPKRILRYGHIDDLGLSNVLHAAP